MSAARAGGRAGWFRALGESHAPNANLVRESFRAMPLLIRMDWDAVKENVRP